jgi:hypothetical protein
LREDRIMIQITCKDKNGDTVKPVFSLKKDIVRGVVAGINELIREDRKLSVKEDKKISLKEDIVTGVLEGINQLIREEDKNLIKSI